MGLPAHPLTTKAAGRVVWHRTFLEKWQKVKGLVKSKRSYSAAPSAATGSKLFTFGGVFFFFNGLMGNKGDIFIVHCL